MSIEGVTEQIAIFLRARKTLPYCDDCLLMEVPGASIDEVREATAILRDQVNFLPAEPSPCVECGKNKPVVMALIG